MDWGWLTERSEEHQDTEKRTVGLHALVSGEQDAKDEGCKFP